MNEATTIWVLLALVWGIILYLAYRRGRKDSRIPKPSEELVQKTLKGMYGEDDV